jgi:hypothetical protein
MENREYHRNRGDVPIKLNQETKQALRVSINRKIQRYLPFDPLLIDFRVLLD